MLRTFGKTLAALSVLALFAACANTADAGWGIKDLDPTNKNSGVRKSARKFDRNRIKKTNSVLHGGSFTVTLQNPTRKGITFKIGDKPYWVSAGRQITIRGTGRCRIRFGYGLNNGSYKYYNLGSGQTFHFKWHQDNLPSYGRIWLLDLYKSR